MPATLEPAALTGAELARWLLPLLKEYTDKLNGVCDRLFQIAERDSNPLSMARAVPHLARFLAAQSTLKRLLLGYTSRASALLDHHDFEDDELKLELSGRWEEAEDTIRASDVLMKHLGRQLESAGHGGQLQAMIDHIQLGTGN